MQQLIESSTESPGGEKKILMLAPPKGNVDEFGVLRAAATTYAAAFQRRGYRVRWLDTGGSQFSSVLIALLRDPKVAAAYSVTWATPYIQFMKDGGVVGAFEHFNKPHIYKYGDSPFCPWIVSRLHYDFSHNFSFYNDEASIDLVPRIIAPKGHHEFDPPTYYDVFHDPVRTAIPPSHRDIPLLYVGKHVNTNLMREQFCRRRPRNAAIFDALIERALYDRYTPLWRLAEATFLDAGRPFDVADTATREILFESYYWIHGRRRQLLLERVARHPVVIVTKAVSIFDQSGLHPKARVLEPKSAEEVFALYEQARAVVIAQPNYTHGWTERITTAMHRRAAVVTTTNHWIDKTFIPDRHLLTLASDLSDLDEQIARLADSRFVDALSHEAWRRIENDFSPDAAVGRYLEVLDRAGFAL